MAANFVDFANKIKRIAILPSLLFMGFHENTYTIVAAYLHFKAT